MNNSNSGSNIGVYLSIAWWNDKFISMIFVWKRFFIKHYMSWDNCLSFLSKTNVIYMTNTISKKQTTNRVKSKFTLIVWTQVRITCATKNLEFFVIWFSFNQHFIWVFSFKNIYRKNIDGMNNNNEGFSPKLKRKKGCGEQGDPISTIWGCFLSTNLFLSCVYGHERQCWIPHAWR